MSTQQHIHQMRRQSSLERQHHEEDDGEGDSNRDGALVGLGVGEDTFSEQGSTATCLGDTDRRINVRTLSLIVCTVSYLMFGAAVFDFIESEHEEEQRAQLIALERSIIARYNITASDSKKLEHIYVRLVPFKSGIQWKFTGAFYFVLTVITTIGYGHAAPATAIGKMFCMAYAFIGIPLSLTVYQAVGERLNTFTAWWLMHAKSKFFHRPRVDVQVTQTELVMAGWSACSLVLFGGAAVFSHYEQWTYFDSLYYCYITLTTIGFGDYIALQNDDALQKEPKYVFFSILYIMVALCVVASSINLLVLKFLTMNTMDEKESAQMEARKHFSNVLRQVAHERSHSTASVYQQQQQHQNPPQLPPPPQSTLTQINHPFDMNKDRNKTGVNSPTKIITNNTDQCVPQQLIQQKQSSKLNPNTTNNRPTTITTTNRSNEYSNWDHSPGVNNPNNNNNNNNTQGSTETLPTVFQQNGIDSNKRLYTKHCTTAGGFNKQNACSSMKRIY